MRETGALTAAGRTLTYVCGTIGSVNGIEGQASRSACAEATEQADNLRFSNTKHGEKRGQA